MAKALIRTPGAVCKKGKNGSVSFAFNGGCAARLGGLLARAQSTVESEVLRRCEPLVPRGTGRLAASGRAENGEVTYTAPYARRLYYNAAASSASGLRGPMWFERMKATHSAAILQAAQSQLGR